MNGSPWVVEVAIVPHVEDVGVSYWADAAATRADRMYSLFNYI